MPRTPDQRRALAAAPRIDAEQVATFRREGHLLVRGLLDGAAVAAMRGAPICWSLSRTPGRI